MFPRVTIKSYGNSMFSLEKWDYFILLGESQFKLENCWKGSLENLVSWSVLGAKGAPILTMVNYSVAANSTRLITWVYMT